MTNLHIPHKSVHAYFLAAALIEEGQSSSKTHVWGTCRVRVVARQDQTERRAA